MKHNQKTRKAMAFIISIAMIMSLTAVSSVTAFAADTSKTSSEYSITDATSFVFSDSGITVTEGAYSGYKIEGTALTIKESGTYVVSGSCANGTIVVKKNVTGVTLVLNGLTLSASATAPITCNKGSEVSIVAAAGTVNNLADDKYNNDDTYTDETLYPDIENAVIKCKDGSNVTICGKGTINITANGKNGIKGGFDLYEEDEEGNATSTLLSISSLTIKEVTLDITANVNDGLKSDKELNILSGNITVSAVDDGIKCDYVLNIGAEGAEGPTINVKKSKEGIETATLNVYSGNITVNATDDGINAANSDLSNYSFSYNQYGGTVYVNVTNGDGIDSNGTINLIGGTLEVYTPSQGDGDPLDAERGVYFKGATVLAVGHLGMAQGYSAATPYVTFGSAGGMGGQTNLVTAGSMIRITDASGNELYSAKAVRNASYILFASSELTTGSSYSLKSGTTTSATSTAGTASNGAMGMGGQMPGNMGGNQGRMPGNMSGDQGQAPGFFGNNRSQQPGDQRQLPGNDFGSQIRIPGVNGNNEQMPGGRQNGGFPGQNSENAGEVPTPPEMNAGEGSSTATPGENADAPQIPGGNAPAIPSENGNAPQRPEMNGKGNVTTHPDQDNGESVPEIPQDGERPSLPEEARDGVSEPNETEFVPAESAESTNWFMAIINAIRDFFRSLFG